MASQSQAEISDEETEENAENDPIEVAINVGARLSTPTSASISRKRKLIHVNQGKYKQRESGGSASGKGNAACDRVKD
jgi:hypothetical protein